jgi:hypothetical protein
MGWLWSLAMRATLLVFALILGAVAAGGARAGSARCWYENGAIVVSAAAGDIADDYILDLSAPRSLLHDTRVQAAGIAASEVALPVRLAGERLGVTSFQVAGLDARTRGFPTNIAGVIGADALKDRVVDIQLSPCRIMVWRGRPRPFGPALRLPLRWVGGVPTLQAAIADGVSTRAGRFAVDTASAGMRIAAREATLSRAPAPGVDAASRSHPPARLRALSFGGVLAQNLAAGVDADIPEGVLGGVGDGVWDRYVMRVDLRRGRLELTDLRRPRRGLAPPPPPRCARRSPSPVSRVRSEAALLLLTRTAGEVALGATPSP